MQYLSQAAFSLCDAIPTQCIQLHNLILSAFPVTASFRLPDPLQAGLKIELLPEISKSPQILADYTAALSSAELRAPLDKFLQTRVPASLPTTLRERLQFVSRVAEGELKYNIPLTNSLVMHLGVVAVNQSKAQTGAVAFVAKSASSVLLQQLIAESEPEGVLYSTLGFGPVDADSCFVRPVLLDLRRREPVEVPQRSLVLVRFPPLFPFVLRLLRLTSSFATLGSRPSSCTPSRTQTTSSFASKLYVAP